MLAFWHYFPGLVNRSRCSGRYGSAQRANLMKFAELGLVPICDRRLKPVRILRLTSLSPVSLLHKNPDV